MKKSFYVALVAIAAVAFTSCKPGEDKPGGGDDPQAKVTITAQPKSLLMAPEDQERVRAIVSPAGTELALSWKSTNPAVATVTSSGMVTAVDLGSALVIVSAEGIEPDTCEVTVSDIAELKAYEIEDYGVFGSAPDTIYPNTDIYLSPSWLPEREGGYHCVIAGWPVYMWDGNVTFVNGTGWVGNGYLLVSEVPFYTLDDEAAGEDNGSPFGWGTFTLKEAQATVTHNVGEAGWFDKDYYGQFLDTWLDELAKGEDADGSGVDYELCDKGIGGAQIWWTEVLSSGRRYYDGSYGYASALVKDFSMTWNSAASTFTYTADIDWFDPAEDRFNGMLIKETETYFTGVKPYDFSFISLHYSNAENEEVAPNNEFYRLKRIKEMPEMPKMLTTRSFKATDKLYRK